jgi:probable HAF family extracellular repeat protein
MVGQLVRVLAVGFVLGALGACREPVAPVTPVGPSPNDVPPRITGTDPRIASANEECPTRCAIPITASVGFVLALNEHASILMSGGTGGVFVWSKGGGEKQVASVGAGHHGKDLNSWHSIVVGHAFVDGGIRGVMWDENGNPIKLPTLGGEQGFATAVNDWGTVAGSSYLNNGPLRAYLWDRWERKVIELGTLGGTWSRAADINYYGTIVGASERADGETQAFIWQRGTGMRAIPMIPGSVTSRAHAVNDNGMVVGYSGGVITGNRQEPVGRAFAWTSINGLIDLGTLGGDYSEAYGVNHWGEVVGVSKTADGRKHPFVWRDDTGMQRLDTMGEGGGEAVAINSWGDIVGMVGVKPMAWAWAENRHRWQ